jgi:hypothetical protein
MFVGVVLFAWEGGTVMVLMYDYIACFAEV